ncbi:rhodanese-like domain-containing protein [Pseudobdellovibrio exovorus]|uniref:Rhodanese-related sulfurtransferase n=1 Tax=Pseudobdellovibrio exovorus JSS TaxID=1184267 RepID=M4VBA3_9BACT|nr:rhodanese-like domain-containing protein [Pseudobdellovibrio exovorus]AGH96473.1 rhodanese-related sulfurtransferase [Pseudobdellovibrio exovorus JSS]
MLYEFKNKSTNPHFTEVEDVTPQEVFESTEKVKLVDVREISEFTGELGHAPQSELVVLSTLPEKLKSLPQDKTIVFICRSGGRSAQAAAYAKQQGYQNVHNMLGGMLLWNQLQLPTEK